MSDPLDPAGVRAPLVPLTPLDLGLSEPPQAPAVPSFGAPPPDFKAKLLRLIAAGVAGGLGPGAGTGLLQGLQIADQQKARDQQIKDQQARLLYTEQSNQYEQQRRLYEQDADQRQRTLQTNLDALRRVAPTLKTKADYDRHIDAYANGLRGMGLRIDGNYLRTAVPYVAPTATKEAAAVIDTYFTNSVNKQRIEQAPDTINDLPFYFDRDGDGVKELVSFRELTEIAEMPVEVKDGRVVLFPKGTTKEIKANADGILQTLMERAQAEGKAMTPDLMIALQQEAIRQARDAGGGDSDFEGYVARLEQERGRRLTAREFRQARHAFTPAGGGSSSLVQSQARDALRAALLTGSGITPALVAQLRAALLNPDVELAAAREAFIRVGRQLTDALDDAPSAEELFERGRQALRGHGAPRVPPPVPTPIPRAEVPALRQEARRQLEAARRAASDPRPVTEADVEAVLAKPGNVDVLRRQSGGWAMTRTRAEHEPVVPARRWRRLASPVETIHGGSAARAPTSRFRREGAGRRRASSSESPRTSAAFLNSHGPSTA